jgi:hypothetical protein
MTLSSLSAIRSVFHPAAAAPAELTAATELGRIAGATVAASAARGRGLNVALAGRGWATNLPDAAKSAAAWMWLRIADDGTGEIVSSHGSFLFAAVRLLANGVGDLTREKLAAGVFLPATFGWHRPHWDACYTQYWRSARGFDPERYVAALAEAGFTHCEVNGLQTHMPHEDLVAWEYYSQFYTYAPGFNHFVDTPLTKGLWPALYLDANLNHLRQLADLGQAERRAAHQVRRQELLRLGFGAFPTRQAIGAAAWLASGATGSPPASILFSSSAFSA